MQTRAVNLLFVIFISLFIPIGCNPYHSSARKIESVRQAEELEEKMTLWRESQILEDHLELARHPNLIDDSTLREEVTESQYLWEEAVERYAKKQRKDGIEFDSAMDFMRPEYASFSDEDRAHYRAILKIYLDEKQRWRDLKEMESREDWYRETFRHDFYRK